jgi:hypothetical protein
MHVQKIASNNCPLSCELFAALPTSSHHGIDTQPHTCKTGNQKEAQKNQLLRKHQKDPRQPQLNNEVGKPGRLRRLPHAVSRGKLSLYRNFGRYGLRPMRGDLPCLSGRVPGYMQHDYGL